MTSGLDTSPHMSVFHMCLLCKVVLVTGSDSGMNLTSHLKVVEKKHWGWSLKIYPHQDLSVNNIHKKELWTSWDYVKLCTLSVFERNTQFVCVWTQGSRWRKMDWQMLNTEVLQSLRVEYLRHSTTSKYSFENGQAASNNHVITDVLHDARRLTSHQSEQDRGWKEKRHDLLQFIGEYTCSSAISRCIKLLTKVWNSRAISLPL